MYATLAAALVVAALGAYVQILTGLSAGLVGVIGGVICMTALSVLQPTAYNINRRYLPSLYFPLDLKAARTLNSEGRGRYGRLLAQKDCNE